MIDMLKISIPFKDEYLCQSKELNGVTVTYVDLQKVAANSEIKLESRSVFITGSDDSEDKFEVCDLRHPYDSIPTHFTGMAFKIFQGTPLRPACVEIKASPAKLIQGHNVYGSTNIEQGSTEMLCALLAANFELYDMLDVPNATLDSLDATYSARLADESQLKQVINQLKNVSNAQMRTAVRNEYETTTYFTRGSRHVDRKAYMKGAEFKSQLDRLRKAYAKGETQHKRVIDVMSDPKLINYARNLLRFEASAKRRYLNEFKIPTLLSDAVAFQKEYEKDGQSLIADIWTKAFTPLFDAFKGKNMNVYDDEKILNELKKHYFKVNKKGETTYTKAKRIHCFYRSLLAQGYYNLRESFSTRQSFNGNIRELLVTGVSKAQLQQLDGTGSNNVVPILSLIQPDFSNQFPKDWKAPIPLMTSLFMTPNNVTPIRAA